MYDEQPFKIDYSCTALWGAIAIGGPLAWAALIWMLI
jgi:hypothetical protein